jgi:putative transposase
MRPDRKRNRLFGADYSQEAFYFVTSCVKEMVCALGEVVKEEMHLNAYGQIAERQWYWLMEKYPYVQSHAFVVMPNHIHALVEICREDVVVERGANDQVCEDQECVQTGPALSLQFSHTHR